MFFRCIILLLLSTSALATDITVAIHDTPREGSPLRNIGTVTFSLTTTPSGKLLMSRRDDWKAINISSRPIVALIETLSIKLPNDRAMERVARYEAFFHPSLVEPSESADLYSEGTELFIDRAEPEDFHPVCDVSVRWVQFDDGTIFGESSFADEFLRERRETWNALRRIYDVYTQQGELAFATALAERVSSSPADTYVEHLRIFQKKHGTAATIGRLEEHLKMAELRSPLVQDSNKNPK